MVHQNFQEAIEELSTNADSNTEEIKSQFNLSHEEMMAMISYDPILQPKMPRPVAVCCGLCSCCYQSDN